VKRAYTYITTALSLIWLICTGSGPALYRAMIGTSCDCEECKCERKEVTP